jgi:hypothetical protein
MMAQPVCADNYPIATIEFIESTLNSKQLSK